MGKTAAKDAKSLLLVDMHRSKMSVLKLPSGNQKENKSLRWIFQMGVFDCLRMGEWWVGLGSNYFPLGSSF